MKASATTRVEVSSTEEPKSAVIAAEDIAKSLRIRVASCAFRLRPNQLDVFVNVFDLCKAPSNGKSSQSVASSLSGCLNTRPHYNDIGVIWG